MNKKIIVSLLLISFSFSFSTHGATLITGNPGAPEGQTFSFPVNKYVMSPRGNFYESTNTTLLENQQFTLSRLINGATAFAPLTPEFVTLNGIIDSENPIFGAQILALGILETEDGLFRQDLPVTVAANRPATVYLLEKISNPNNMLMFSSGDVHDAQGNVSSGIVDLATDTKDYVFAAVKPNAQDSNFGDLNSGIALLVHGDVEKMLQFREADAVLGGIVPRPKALLLDPTSPSLNIQSSILAQITPNTVAMHWDSSLKQLFIALQVTANSQNGDGARAITMAQFNETGGITLQTIAPDSAFAAGNLNSIIGVLGANQQVKINAIDSLYTSTRLHYLIVVGGVVQDPDTTQQTVYALPLVNTADAKGTIAQKDAQPQNVFDTTANVPFLINRTISQPATTPDEMPQATDIAVQVGGGPLLAGPIVNIITRDDTVFAFVGQDNPGVYFSQAIFTAAGKITSWTAWQRTAGTTNNIFGAVLDIFSGTFILTSGPTADAVNTIQRTVWSDGSPTGLQPLTSIVTSALGTTNGGVQGLQIFPPNTPGLNQISVAGFGGIGALVLAQTGTLNNTIITPTPASEFNQTATFENGTITTDVDAKTVIINGGALSEVGPITALEFAVNEQNGWLFVGGSQGLAILAQNDGTGWDPTTNLGNNFAGLTNGMTFKTVGDYNFVKKIIYDGDLVNYNFLYVISNNKVDRINLTTSNFGTNTLDVTTIASIGADGVTTTGGFLDGIFSQACGIIATTDNLLRIGDGQDVRTITSEADADWTNVPISENAGAPTALYTVTQTNRAQDITRNSGGHFYVLTADVGIDRSRINRFAVSQLQPTTAMTAQTVTPFDDLFVQNIPSFLLSFGEFRSNFATDGGLYFATRNQNGNLPPIAMITTPLSAPRVGVREIGDRSIPVNINFQQGTEINGFTLSPASGSWIIAGNFNTQVLE